MSAFKGPLLVIWIVNPLVLNMAYGQDVQPRGSIIADLMEFYGMYLQAIWPPELFTANVSLPCLTALGSHSVLNNAGKYLDAMGKPPSGLFDGGIYWIGSYSTCLSIPDAHYCSLQNIKVPQTWLTLGVCMPKDCSAIDVSTLFRNLATVINQKDYFDVTINPVFRKLFNQEAFCYGEKRIDSYAVGFLCFCAVVLLLVFVGTVVDIARRMILFSRPPTTDNGRSLTPDAAALSLSDKPGQLLYMKKKVEKFEVDEVDPSKSDTVTSIRVCYRDEVKGSWPVRLLACFSLAKNCESLFSTVTEKDAIMSLNGIRVLSMSWLVLGHTYNFYLSSSTQTVPTSNALPTLQVAKRFSFQAVLSGQMSVETFFFLGGLLVAYMTLRRWDEGGRYRVLRYFGHRFVRILPLYIFVLLFFAFIFPYLGDGPLWLFADIKDSPVAETCKKYMWANVLFLHNFFPSDRQPCVAWTWYLAADMQFYVVALLILLTIRKYHAYGAVVINGLLLASSLGVTALLFGYYNASAVNDVFGGVWAEPNDDGLRLTEKPANYYKYIVYKPYVRIPPYLIGILLGYLLTKRKRLDGGRRQLYACIGWFSAVVVAVAVVYGPYTFTSLEYKWGLVQEVLYGTLARVGWSLSLAWLVFACESDVGGFINRFLSWKGFVPLSRLTYGVFLVNPLVILLFFSSQETLLYYTDLNAVFFFVAFLVMSYVASFVITVCLECPVRQLERLFLKV